MLRAMSPALGLVLLVAMLSETAYSVFYETDYSGKENFFCDVVAA